MPRDKEEIREREHMRAHTTASISTLMKKQAILLLASMATALLLASVVALVASSKPAEATFPGANGKIAFFSDRETSENPDLYDEPRRLGC
jgi:hypothetical protein